MSDDNIIHVDFASGDIRPGGKPATPPDVAPEAKPRARDPLGDLYSARDAAKLFGIGEGKLRYWERTGLVVRTGTRGKRRFYTFQDLIGIRAAKALIDSGAPLRAVRQSVEALKVSLPRVSRPLSTLRILADGQSVVVRDDDGAYDPTTGQASLEFDVRSLRDDVVRVLRRNGEPNSHRVAYEHYLDGCRLDEDDSTYAEAEAAYRRAVALDPSLANAITNLGNLLFRKGESTEAEQLYVRALRIDPDQPEAFYNLGFLRYEQGDLSAAVLNFKRAIDSDPAFSDAHFNLAMALHDLGRPDEARSHWQIYLELDPESAWAEIARRHLRPQR